MKTAGSSTANMLTAITLLASLTMQSFAAPLASYWDVRVGDDGSQQRSKREAANPAAYPVESFLLRPFWRNQSCNTTYNCAPVSQLHCSEVSKANYFSPVAVNSNAIGCELDFEILVDDGGVTDGAELALYKRTEQSTGSHLRYYVFIAFKQQGVGYYSKLVASRHIEPECKSWQVFNISSIKDDLPVGVHNITLLVAVFKELDPIQGAVSMSCNEVKSLFIMDTSADLNEFEIKPTEMPTVGDLDSHGGMKSTKGTEDNKSEQEEQGSGGGKDLGSVTITSSITIQEEAVSIVDYLPSMVVFVSGAPSNLVKKRSVTEPAFKIEEGSTKEIQMVTVARQQVEEETDVSSGANCRLHENKLVLSNKYPHILEPTIVNVGMCSNSTGTMECRPTGFKNLVVLIKLNGTLIIDVLDDFITTECTPFINTQPSMTTSNSSESGHTRRRRLINGTPETVDQEQDTNEEKDALNVTVTEPDVIIVPEEENSMDESSGTGAASCRRLDKKVYLSNEEPNVLRPLIANVGMCSDSTDAVECRPTGFTKLDVLIKRSDGVVKIEARENFIITECTPFVSTPQPITTA